MNNDIIANPLIDPNIKSYESFFDHAWCKSMFDEVNDSVLDDPVTKLIVAWRSTNGAHILPWLMIESLKNYAIGSIEVSELRRVTYSGTLINGISNKLERLMGYSLNFDQRRALKKAITRIEKEVHEAIEKAHKQIEPDILQHWSTMVRSSEFTFSILGLQRSNYASLYFAYEDFLSDVIRTKVSEFSSKNTNIGKAFEQYFGHELANFCWYHDEVELPRRIRNALVHNGGKFGPYLETYIARFDDATAVSNPQLNENRFILIHERIQITPDNTSYLFKVLKERVTKIVDSLNPKTPS